jgi:hypothetical protein
MIETFLFDHLSYEYAVAQLVEALRLKPEGRGFDSLCCQWNFLPVALWTWG